MTTKQLRLDIDEGGPLSSFMDNLKRRMVNRFLGWRLPQWFTPDGYVAFDRVRAEASHSWPIGTNLFSAEQAREMVDHMLADIQEISGFAAQPASVAAPVAAPVEESGWLVELVSPLNGNTIAYLAVCSGLYAWDPTASGDCVLRLARKSDAQHLMDVLRQKQQHPAGMRVSQHLWT